MTAVAEAALAYASQGIPVLPLYPIRARRCACGDPSDRTPGKHPISAFVPQGLKNATTDAETIRHWWAEWPDANIGGRLGLGRVVLDVDPRNGGDRSLEELVAKHGPLPPGPVAQTGGGGRHYWFSVPGGDAPISHGFRPGLDFQGDGSYVVLPPSGHASGASYRWETPLVGDQLPPVPGWLYTAATERASRRTRGFEAGADGRIPHGRHHDFIVQTAASFASRISGIDLATLTRQVRAAMRETIDDADSHEAEIVEACRSAIAKYGRPVAPGRPESSERSEPAPPPPEDAALPPPPDGPKAGLWRAGPKGDEIPDRAAFVEHLTSRYRFVSILDTEELLRFEGGVYNSHAPQFVKEWVEGRFKERGKSSAAQWRKEVIDSIRARCYVSREEFNPRGWLCLENGLLNLTTPSAPVFQRHDPEIKFTLRLPVAYDPIASCPRFLAFLEEILPDASERELLREEFGYCLMPGNPYKVAFFWLGPTDSGKSTLMTILRGLLGRKNVTAASLQALAENRFAAASLWGKLANLYPDLSSKMVRDTGLFKMLVGGSDELPAEKKFQEPFTFINVAKMFFSANEMPPVPTADAAFFRRWILTRFPVSILAYRQIPDLAETILRDEVKGILNWALGGLASLSARGRFELSGTPEELGKVWRRLSSSLEWFVQEVVIRDTDSSVAKADLYARYTEFCQDHGVQPRSQTDLANELPQMVPGAHQNVAKPGGRRGKSVRVWKGIKLKSDDPELGSTFDAPAATLDDVGPMDRSTDSGSTGSTGSTPLSGMTHAREESGTIPEDPVEPVERVERPVCEELENWTVPAADRSRGRGGRAA